MRKVLMAGVVALWPMVAHAQVATLDMAAVMKLGEQLVEMKQMYDATMGILGAAIRQFDPNSIVGSLGNALPGVGDISRTMTGQSGLGGLSGILGGFRDRNTYYRPQGDDFAATTMDRMGNSWGGTQAMGEALMQSIAGRMGNIETLQAQLSGVTTDADLSALRGRIEAEKAMMTGETAQAQAIGNMMAAQREQYQLMQWQRSRQSADELYRSAFEARQAGGAQSSGLMASFPTFVDNGQ